jgi:hypothetical protein
MTNRIEKKRSRRRIVWRKKSEIFRNHIYFDYFQSWGKREVLIREVTNPHDRFCDVS